MSDGSLTHWAKQIHVKGVYAAGANGDERKISEKSAISDWEKQSDLTFRKIREGPKGKAPDFYVDLKEGRTLSIEVSELCSADIRKRISKYDKEGRDYRETGDYFDNSQWTRTTFYYEIERILKKKHEKYVKRSPPLTIDVLLLATQERWLMPSQIERWLPNLKFNAYSSFGVAILVHHHNIEGSKTYPPFELFGDLSL